MEASENFHGNFHGSFRVFPWKLPGKPLRQPRTLSQLLWKLPPVSMEVAEASVDVVEASVETVEASTTSHYRKQQCRRTYNDDGDGDAQIILPLLSRFQCARQGNGSLYRQRIPCDRMTAPRPPHMAPQGVIGKMKGPNAKVWRWGPSFCR